MEKAVVLIINFNQSLNEIKFITRSNNLYKIKQT